MARAELLAMDVLLWRSMLQLLRLLLLLLLLLSVHCRLGICLLQRQNTRRAQSQD
jgi:hypothetical protein